MAYFPRPVARGVSSALRRFTSVFGMGTGGATALQPPGLPTIERPRASRKPAPATTAREEPSSGRRAGRCAGAWLQGAGAERWRVGGPGRKTGGAGAPPGHLFGSGRGIRTPDLRVMSPMSYRCSIPRRYATSIARAAAPPGSAAGVVPAPAHGRAHEWVSYDSWGTGEGSRMRLMKGQALDH